LHEKLVVIEQENENPGKAIKKKWNNIIFIRNENYQDG